MRIKQAVTRSLMDRLPADEQAQLVADIIAWQSSDLPLADQQERVKQFGPSLMQMMRAGRVGLPLLVHKHLLRLAQVRKPTQRTGASVAGLGYWRGR